MRSAMYAASQLPGKSTQMLMMLLHLHVNQKYDDNGNEDVPELDKFLNPIRF